MGEWHLSKYNIFSSNPIDNKIPCINLLKRTYSELDIKELRELYSNLNKIENIEEDLKDFIKQGIIVNYNEQEYIKTQLFFNFNKTNEIKILIAPSLNCNFNCPYCFEKHSDKNVMSKEIQDETINFLKNIASFSFKKKLSITWYGGEPLLYPKIIEYISNSIIPFCEQRNIQYKASILTNGYYFNQENADLLFRCKVNDVQITLDGLQENHDKTRFLSNGTGSFNTIINNLKTVKYLGHISIRHDIHIDNQTETKELKKLIEEIGRENKLNINYYTAPIIDNPAENSKEKVNYLDIRGRIKFELERKNGIMPSFRTSFCGASSLYFFGIDSHGDLCKCWEDFGVKERVYGNIKTWDIKNPLKTATNPDVLIKYLNCAGVLDSECYECVWLPICGGGCPSKRFYCNMKCYPYVPYKYDVDYFIELLQKTMFNKDFNKNEQ